MATILFVAFVVGLRMGRNSRMEREFIDIYLDLENERESLQKRTLAFCRQYLYKGKRVKFKRANMKHAVPCEILGSFVDYDIRIAVRVKNLDTGKTRKIAFEDILEKKC
jgi:hypothetical protein